MINKTNEVEKPGLQIGNNLHWKSTLNILSAL
jgi:hypothetical protein